MDFKGDQRQLRQTLEREGIQDARVLDAIQAIRRDRFVPEDQLPFAYNNSALPIGMGQTISQPYIVALMTEALSLTPKSQVLEIGTGCGYQTAVIGELADRVVTIERIAELSTEAEARLTSLGYDRVDFLIGDGTQGWPEFAPYDAIIATAAGPKMPRSLYDQLKPNAKLVIPVGDRSIQSLQCIERTAEGPRTTELCGCRFVKLIGAEGWVS